MQESQPLGRHLLTEKIDSCRIAPRTREASDKTKLNRISGDTEDDRDRRRCSFGRARCRPAARYGDHGHRATDQIGDQWRQAIILALQPVIFDGDVLPFDVTGFMEAFTERCHITRADFRRPRMKKLGNRPRRLLRPRRERPSGRAAEKRD
jgi:hypothetical protein